MTVWVDDMHLYAMGQFQRMKMSHMISDVEAELHAMAQAVGVARRWYQGDHYDVSKSCRAKAIALGAVAISLQDLSVMCMFRRQRGFLPRHDEVPAIRAEMAARIRAQYA